jgi:hypothetical protein
VFSAPSNPIKPNPFDLSRALAYVFLRVSTSRR